MNKHSGKQIRGNVKALDAVAMRGSLQDLSRMQKPLGHLDAEYMTASFIHPSQLSLEITVKKIVDLHQGVHI